MQTGMFRGGRPGWRALWLVVPVVILAAIYLLSGHYRACLKRQLDQRAAALRVVPEMSSRYNRAQALLKSYTLASGADPTTEFTVLLNYATREQGVAVRSLTIDRSARPAIPHMSAFRMVLQAEGPLAALVGLFHALQHSERLFVVESVRLGMVGQGPLYSGDIALECYVLSP